MARTERPVHRHRASNREAAVVGRGKSGCTQIVGQIGDGEPAERPLRRIDDRGLVYIVDRAKDMINRGGENVYSVEVENALAGAPAVAEAAVVGVPDSVMGEKVGAVLVPLPGAEVDARAIITHCRERLADFKVPQFLSIRSEPLPRNPGGKVLKKVLREESRWEPAPR